MQENWGVALQLVLAHEGGLVDNPNDPGGRTNKGVTQRVYDAYRSARKLPTQDVAQMADDECREIYDEQYWKPSGAPMLPAGLDYAVFDYAVNSGVGRAVEDLQRTVGSPVDGHFGNITLAKVEAACDQSDVDVISAYCARRMRFLQGLKGWKDFGKGWDRRVNGSMPGAQQGDLGVLDYAVSLAKKDLKYPLPQLALPMPIGSQDGEVAAKAPPNTASIAKNPMTIGLGVAGVGVAGQTMAFFAEQVKPYISHDPLGQVALGVFLVLMGAGGIITVGTHLVSLKEQLMKG